MVEYKLIDDGENSYKIEWLEEKPIMNSIENFLKAYGSMEFISTSGKSSQYVEFGEDFEKVLNSIFGKDYCVEVSIGHFDIYGFISHNDKFVYFGLGDIRDDGYFNWRDRVLYRTAKNNTDYTGGSNRFCYLLDFEKSVKSLLGKEC